MENKIVTIQPQCIKCMRLKLIPTARSNTLQGGYVGVAALLLKMKYIQFEGSSDAKMVHSEAQWNHHNSHNSVFPPDACEQQCYPVHTGTDVSCYLISQSWIGWRPFFFSHKYKGEENGLTVA